MTGRRGQPAGLTGYARLSMGTEPAPRALSLGCCVVFQSTGSEASLRFSCLPDRDVDRLSPSRSSNAQRRLALGITGVGSSVVLAATWIAVTVTGVVALPTGWHPLSRSYGFIADATIAAVMIFILHAILLAPVEYRGGVVVVRDRPGFLVWLRRWLRGVTVQGTVFAIAAATLATGAQLGGAPGLPAAALTGVILLLALQGPIARIMASLPLVKPNDSVRSAAVSAGTDPNRIRVASVNDEAFVGGWIGLVSPELWIPERWTGDGNRSLLSVQLARRHHQWRSGGRRRGLVGAVLWNVTGILLLSALLPWPLADARTFLVLPAVATLWSFLAVLLLPTPSRTAVYDADQSAVAQLGVGAVTDAVVQLDRWQDDEAERTPGVERVFHPVPSRGNRLRALARWEPTSGGGHQLTRLTLYSSLATLSLLGRVVHCNIGRPALWAVYPGD